MELIATRILMFLATVVDASTGIVIGLGVLGAAVRALRFCFGRRMKLAEAMSEIRFTLGRWLALSLELALAADILRSVIAPTWNEIGKLGAIVALRTVLNYFLEREIEHALRMKSEYVLQTAA